MLVRPYAYSSPGFYAGQDLVTRVSSAALVDADDEHQKVRIAPGDVLYARGRDGAIVRIDVGEKPGRARIALTMTRVQ